MHPSDTFTEMSSDDEEEHKTQDIKSDVKRDGYVLTIFSNSCRTPSGRSQP